MQHWIERYPHSVFASALLLDNKIEQWQVGQKYWESPFEISAFEQKKRFNDYKTEFKEFVVNTPEEHDQVFRELAPEWFRQWELVKNYWGYRPYEIEKKATKFNKGIGDWHPLLNHLVFIPRLIREMQRGKTANHQKDQ